MKVARDAFASTKQSRQDHRWHRCALGPGLPGRAYSLSISSCTAPRWVRIGPTGSVRASRMVFPPQRLRTPPKAEEPVYWSG